MHNGPRSRLEQSLVHLCLFSYLRFVDCYIYVPNTPGEKKKNFPQFKFKAADYLNDKATESNSSARHLNLCYNNTI